MDGPKSEQISNKSAMIPISKKTFVFSLYF